MATKPKLGIPVNASPLVFLDDNPDDYIGDRYIQPVAPQAPALEDTSTFRRVVGDGAITALKGAIGVPEAAVGLADIVTGGNVGKALENQDGAIGFRPKQAREFLDQFYSPAQQAANRAVQEAANPEDSLPKRILDTGVAALRNPSTIVHAVGESLPSMGAGGVLARGVMAMAPRMSAFAAAGVGEGVVGAGSSASQIRQETPDGLLTPGQSAIAAGSGALTAGLGIVAGKVARSMGIGDIDTMIAGGGGATPQMQKGFVRKLLEGAFTEGVLEELPQSVQEQVAQNYALGKPLDEGVDQAAVMGLLSGGAMGAGAANIGRPVVPNVGPLSRGANTAAATMPPVAPTAPTAGEAPSAPIAPVAPLAPEQEQQMLQQANTRLAELDQKAKGTKEKKEGDKIVTPEVPAQLLTPEETKEREFLQQAGGDVQALQRMFGAPEAPAPVEATSASDRAAAAQRAADKPALPTETAREGDILNSQGKPFTTMPGAMRAQRQAGDGFEIVPVRNGDRAGLVVRQKKPAATVPEAAPAAAVSEAPQSPASPSPAAPEPVAEARSIAGPKIDAEWTAFTPESGTRNVPRADMPQIRSIHRGAMTNFLNARGIEHEQDEVPANSLKPTQAEFSPEKVRKAREYAGDTDRSILVSEDGHVLDGHHQWLAKLEDSQPVKVIRLKAPIDRLLAEVREFPSAQQADGATDAAPTPESKDPAPAPDMGNPMSEDVPPASDAVPAEEPEQVQPQAQAGTPAEGAGDSRPTPAAPAADPKSASSDEPQQAPADPAFPNAVTRAKKAKQPAPRAMTYEGRAVDGGPLNPGDIFTTASGRTTTAYPSQKGQKFHTQWLIDNAVAEAQARGDDFNTRMFSAEKPGRDGFLPPASGDSMTEYLFGQQPAVPRPFLKPLNAEPTAKPQASANTIFTEEAAPADATVRIPPEVDAALTEDMTRQQARMKRLRTAAESPDLSLDDKLAAQTKAKAAEATLAKMRRTRFDAEDAIAASQDFAPYADIFPRAAAVLQASAAPAPAPSGNSSTPAPAEPPHPNAITRAKKAKQTEASANTIFTEEAAAAALEVLRRKLRNVNSGIDPELLQAGITRAGYHIERGARTFAAYSKAMLAELGDAIRPYLKSFYMAVKYDPRAAAFEGMDSAAAVEAAGVDAPAAEPEESGTGGNSSTAAVDEPPAVDTKTASSDEPEQDPADPPHPNVVTRAKKANQQRQGAPAEPAVTEPAAAPQAAPVEEAEATLDSAASASVGAPSKRDLLKQVAERLGIKVVYGYAGRPHAGDGYVEVPDADVDTQGAITPNHVFAHELGHAIMQRRGMSFARFPAAEMRKWVSNWDEWVAASKAFRPGIHEHENKRYRDHAKKPDEIIADAIGSVLIGDAPESLVIGKVAGLTRRDLGLEEPTQQPLAEAPESETGGNISTDSPPEVEKKIDLRSGRGSQSVPMALPAPAAGSAGTLTDFLADKIAAGTMPKDNPALRKLVEVYDRQEPTQARMKEAQEALEAAIVGRARDIMATTDGDRRTFDKLVDLYQSQPLLNIRTSTSIANQAYSTPAPLAFVASELAGINPGTTVLEPTAGTGMLLIGTLPDKAIVNELNPDRVALLRAQGFAKVTERDATERVTPLTVDRVITNPPFGPIKDAAGESIKVKVDGFTLGQVDHLIAARALEAMKDDGRAVLIIGANKQAGQQSNNDLIFFNWLYGNYRVTSHFEVDGDLYERQGAGWPVRVIAIQGRFRSNATAPDPDTITRATNWSQVYEQFEQGVAANGPGARPATGTVSPSAVPADDAGSVPGTSRGQAERADSGEPAGRAQRAGGVAGQRPNDDGNRGDVRPEGLGVPDRAQRPDADAAVGRGLEGDAGRSGAGKPAGNPGATALASADNQFQAQYVTRSSRKDDGVLIPVNMAGPTQDALNKLEDAVGDLDTFLQRELGYPSKKALHDAFMGLQVDSVAAAIYQIKQGKGVIIADQTGIGKGRQAAGVIRWALKNGKTPVFVTYKASLFTDMYGDLHDIGSDDVAPLIMNLDAHIKGADDSKLFANRAGLHRRTLGSVAATGKLPEGRNALFMTYSQINVDNVQRTVVQALAPNAVFVLDESHQAGGESNTGEFVRGVLDIAGGVTYLSATYAKRPDNMPVYFKTDMGEAVADDETLMSAMAAGGLPLQTVVANNLVKAGQMFRRERSYDGVSIESRADTAHREEHRRLSDATTVALRAIVGADRAFHEGYIKQLQKELKKEGARAIDDAGNQASKSVDHTEFSSVVHNFVRQMLLGLKAQEAADEAIRSLKRGEKPLITVENTMGSFLGAFLEGKSLAVGDSLGGFNYRTVMSRALERSRYVSVQLPNGEKEKEYIPLSALDPATLQVYERAQEIIDAIDINIPVSPIDWMRQEITKAGYTVAEITGRDMTVDYTDPKAPKLGQLDAREKNDKVRTTRLFNAGKLDVLILNVAGSTGISLHASEKFSDQRQRHMIVAQPAQDINTVMQMLGRIHRTGQVALPKYTLLSADLPSEIRPNALLSAKMKSLNANTSSNTESATSVKAVDMLNKYGDRIVGQHLADNFELAQALGVDATEEGKDAAADTARKATGRLALMPVKVQEQFYAEVEEQYNALLDYLNKTNQNELEPRTFDFEAEERKTEVLFEGQNPESPFGEDAIYGEYSVKAQGKPMTPAEIRAAMTENLGGKEAKQHLYDLSQRLEGAFKSFAAGLKDAQADTARATRAKGLTFLRDHPIGAMFRVDINGDVYNAVVTNIRNTHKANGNPFSLSKFQVTVALNGALRSVTVPGTQFESITTSAITGYGSSIEREFREGPPNERETAKIVTGNLLGAYGELDGTRGSIISFTKADGTTEQGILLPKAFNFEKDTRQDYRLRTPADAIQFLQKSDHKDIGRFGINSRDGAVRVLPSGKGITIQVPKSKAKGGKYFLDKALLAAMGEEFVSQGSFMRATVDGTAAERALAVVMKKQALYALPSMADEARAIVGDEPAPPKPVPPPAFSRNAAAGGMAPARVSEVVNAIRSRWTNAPEVVVVESLQDMKVPERVRAVDAEQRSQGASGAPEGFFYGGRVYLLADQLAQPKDVARVLMHESLGHFGLRGVYGDRLGPILDRMLVLNGAKIRAFNNKRELGFDFADPKQSRAAAEEYLAYMAQETPTIGWVRRAVAAVRSWLREHVPGFNTMQFSSNDLIYEFILPARAWVERGAGEEGRGGQQLAPAMSRADGRDTTAAVANQQDVAGNQGGAPAGDSTEGGARQSYLTDERGKPLVLHHGTSADFESFDLDADARDVGGIWFSDSYNYAYDMAGGGWNIPPSRRRKGRVISARIKSSNPKTIDVLEEGRRVAEEVGIDAPQDAAEAQQILSGSMSWDAVVSDLVSDAKREGHDALVIRNFDDGRVVTSTAYVVFSPDQIEQIKSESPAPDGGGAMFSRAPATETEAFRRWFGDSKVVDADGKPLVVYHGTASDISVFDISRSGESTNNTGFYGQGAYFTEDIEDATGYAAWAERGEGGRNLIPAYLSIRNPVYVHVNPKTEADKSRSRQSLQVLLDQLEKNGVFGTYPDPNEAGSLFGKLTKLLANAEFEKFMGTMYNSQGGGQAVTELAQKAGFDGVAVYSFKRDRNMLIEAVAFRPEQIKSAIGNRGTFDPEDPNILFSRTGALGGAMTQGLNSVRDLHLPAGYKVADLLADVPGRLHWWHKTVGTMYNLAQRSEPFRKVYDGVQEFLNDVSFYAAEAADLAPRILPKLEHMRDVLKSPLSAADTKALAGPVFGGTLTWGRDADGVARPIDDITQDYADTTGEEKGRILMRAGKVTPEVLRMWQGLPIDQFEQIINGKFEREILKPGVVFTAAELKKHFSLTDDQIELYREFRRATDRSLDNLAVSEMLRLAGKDAEPVRDVVLEAGGPRGAADTLREYLLSLAESDAGRAEVLTETANKMLDIAARVEDLQREGYAPLSRFGTYTLEATLPTGERYFSLFETPRERARMQRTLLADGAADIRTGTMSQEDYKLLDGVSPETIALFGEMLGLDSQGDEAKDKAFQEFIRRGVANRSAMKRMLHRKGIAGFSEDAGRVLAAFIYSNGRRTASNLHTGQITQAVSDIPKEQGELKDAAVKLREYVSNPMEEAQGFRALLFAQYLGGSVASAMVNATQPFAVTLPWLSQFGGARKAALQMAAAARDATRDSSGDARLDAALKKAEEDGIVSPQEVHALQAQASGRAQLRSGDGTRSGDAAAMASNAMSRLSLAWGKVFGVAEQFNRRTTYIAAYRTAVEQGMRRPDDFARRAVGETQFTYNKGNKPRWARGAVGSILFTFKQYSVNYVEMLVRMANAGEPGSPERAAGQRAALLALGVLFLLGGAEGLPFVEDVQDVVDGALQRLGYNVSTNQKMKEFFAQQLGKGAGDFVMNGVSGIPGIPIDVSGRLGMGNLIPGTGIFHRKDNYSRDLMELAGPGGDFVKRGFQATEAVIAGDVGKAVNTISPVAVRNATKAADMLDTGMYRDDRSRKVIDTTVGEAIAKGLGFQPRDVAEVQEASYEVQRQKSTYILASSQMREKWARAIFEDDKDLLEEARDDMRSWNEKNPQQRITPNMVAIRRRVAEMRKGKAERVADTAPKAIRAEARRQLQEAL